MALIATVDKVQLADVSGITFDNSLSKGERAARYGERNRAILRLRQKFASRWDTNPGTNMGFTSYSYRGLSSHRVVCLITGQRKAVIKKYGALTRELRDMVAWLKAERCQIVAMESIGSFWKPLYNFFELEEMGSTLFCNQLSNRGQLFILRNPFS